MTSKKVEWLVWVVVEGTHQTGYVWKSVHGCKDDADKAAIRGEIVLMADMIADRPLRLHVSQEGTKP